ncbi:MAG: biotin transporter BioY [Chloroflexi bacterium]|nr:biotin transporter BioY [Chloroflexota bacterium]
MADAVIPQTGILRTAWVKDATLVLSFSFFTALFAQIVLRLPFTTVPITGQTFAVLLAGGALGSRRGALSLLLYMAWGIIGIPVFAPIASATKGELVHFVLPWKGTAALPWDLSSGGYILGFILAAYVVGLLAERGWDRGWRVNLAMLIGNTLIYLPGLAWLGYVIASHTLDTQLGVNLYQLIPGRHAVDKALVGGLYPFILGDLLKLLLASLILPGAWELVHAFKGRDKSS